MSTRLNFCWLCGHSLSDGAVQTNRQDVPKVTNHDSPGQMSFDFFGENKTTLHTEAPQTVPKMFLNPV